MTSLDAYLGTRDAGRVLDIGCGGGRFAKRLVAHSHSVGTVTGLDLNPDVGEAFLKELDLPDAGFVASPIADFLDTDRAFDTISISNALHHLENAGTVLKRLGGIAAPGAVCIISEMHRDDLTPSQQAQYAFHSLMARLHRASGEYHRAPYSVAEIRELLEAAYMGIEHAFETRNSDSDAQPFDDAARSRLRDAVDRAYPDGAPTDVETAFEAVCEQATRNGMGTPPNVTFVCTFA